LSNTNEPHSSREVDEWIAMHDLAESPSSRAWDLVVLGLGYVGLHLALAATGVGARVAGLDTDEARVNGLRRGESHVDGIADADEIGRLI